MVPAAAHPASQRPWAYPDIELLGGHAASPGPSHLGSHPGTPQPAHPIALLHIQGLDQLTQLIDSNISSYGQMDIDGSPGTSSAAAAAVAVASAPTQAAATAAGSAAAQDSSAVPAPLPPAAAPALAAAAAAPAPAYAAAAACGSGCGSAERAGGQGEQLQAGDLGDQDATMEDTTAACLGDGLGSQAVEAQQKRICNLLKASLS